MKELGENALVGLVVLFFATYFIFFVDWLTTPTEVEHSQDGCISYMDKYYCPVDKKSIKLKIK